MTILELEHSALYTILSREGVVENFLRNKEDYPASLNVALPLDYMDHMTTSFSWNKTPEGHKFWESIYDECRITDKYVMLNEFDLYVMREKYPEYFV